MQIPQAITAAERVIKQEALSISAQCCEVVPAGLGENNIAMRETICEGLRDTLGVVVDKEKNNVRGETRVISADESKVKVMIVPANEELVIARETLELL